MQIAYVNGVRYVLRIARQAHKCTKCSGKIQYCSEYVQRTELNRSTNELRHSAICMECYVGPRLERHSKAYKYKRKWYPAKSDGATAMLRSRKRPTAMFTF